MTRDAATSVMATCRPRLTLSTGYSPAGLFHAVDSRPENRISHRVEETSGIAPPSANGFPSRTPGNAPLD